ncbi:MAG: hypothetical protein AB2551_01105 [Candidatus Thiodiazotropha sp.]
MKFKILNEPQLTFGRGDHVCPKTGIESLGVYDINDELRKSELRVGLVGRPKGIDDLKGWLRHCQSFMEGKESKLPNLFRGFGGFSDTHGYYCKLLYGDRSTRPIENSKIQKIQKITDIEERINSCVQLYFEEIRFLAENRPVDVIVCALPDDLFSAVTESPYLTKIKNNEDILEDRPDGQDEESDDEALFGENIDNEETTQLEHNFRRLLKARTMSFGVPLQLAREKIFCVGKSPRDIEDEATRAWNFCTALYYKGIKTIPWRLKEDVNKPRTCYVGVGFYKSRDKKTISTSLAQVFDEYGHGVILRGSPVSIDKDNKRPYMDKQQAFDLLSNALDEYNRALKQSPARVVVHKKSNFREEEIDGFNIALELKGVQLKDYVTVMPSSIKLFSYEIFPPPRGSFLELGDDRAILYTRGFINYYKTYPGGYVPTPVEIRAFENEYSIEDIAKEILGLTKMNWNNARLDGKWPITLECAERVGEILKYVNDKQTPQASYAFYM